MPVITTLESLDNDALVKILTEPKNSVVKQYKALLKMDGVELIFEDGALKAIADKTLEKKTGARGLRSIMEEILLSIMYEVPSDRTIEKVIISADYVNGKADPLIVRNPQKKTADFTAGSVRVKPKDPAV